MHTGGDPQHRRRPVALQVSHPAVDTRLLTVDREYCGGSTMTPTTLADARVQSALRHGVQALNRVANYVLPAALDRRLRELGENKEYLGAAEHEELLALVTFTQERTLEKLQAELALRELQTLVPDEGRP
jgi:hypothetical protein